MQPNPKLHTPMLILFAATTYTFVAASLNNI
jgi:hypothetical protein